MTPPRAVDDAWGPRARRSGGIDAGRVDTRRLVKQLLATAVTGMGVGAVLGAMLRGFAPLVVGYHRVVDDFDEKARGSIPGMLVSRAMLERHLDRIGRTYRFVSLDDLAAILERGGPVPRDIAAVTFDDGYRDVYEHAVPLLLRKGIPAAVFVVSNIVGTRQLQVHDRLFLLLGRAASRPDQLEMILARRFEEASVPADRRDAINASGGSALAMTRALLETLPFDHLESVMDDLEAAVGPARTRNDQDLWSMDWAMLADMRAKGFAIGSHSCRHTLLANETPDVMRREADASRRRLETALGGPIVHFAYPDGSFNTTAIRAVGMAGYKFAYTACSHLNRERPLLTIPRRILWERSSVDAAGRFAPAILDCQVQGLFARGRDCRQSTHG